MRRSITALCVFLAVALAGCAGRFRSDLYAVAPEPYTVGTGDRLRIIVYGQDGLSNSYSVDSMGQISLPLVGFVNVNGMTLTADVNVGTRSVFKYVMGGFFRGMGEAMREP